MARNLKALTQNRWNTTEKSDESRWQDLSRIADSGHSNSVRPSPDIPQKSKLVASGTTTTHCADWQWGTDAFTHPLLASEGEIQIQLQLPTRINAVSIFFH
jgi:hypothetical protein